MNPIDELLEKYCSMSPEEKHKNRDIIMDKLINMDQEAIEDYMSKPVMVITSSRKDTEIECRDMVLYELMGFVETICIDLINMVPLDERHNTVANIIKNYDKENDIDNNGYDYQE